MWNAAIVHTQSLSLQPRNGHSVPFIELRQLFSSKVAAIPPFVDQLVCFILNFRSSDGGEADIEMALHEAPANAVIHGYGEISLKPVYVTSRCYMDGEVSITVRDEGRGYDSSAAAILSVAVSCRRLQVPVRNYFFTILPGRADLPVRSPSRPYRRRVDRALVNGASASPFVVLGAAEMGRCTVQIDH